ncbi:hypothetical protein [Streptosporangium roseum]|uniref:hypothetical protein n=1 Tax=Streptosporangium roseum TaxID=2001 RepID=UPI0033253F1F
MDEELVLDRGNVNAEAQGNLMAFGFARRASTRGPGSKLSSRSVSGSVRGSLMSPGP